MGGHTLMDMDTSYLAGFVDGEGCLRWDGTPRLEVTNTYPDILLKLKERFGGTVRLLKAVPGCRPVYRWGISGIRAMIAINVLRPHLREKLPQAVLLREMWCCPVRERPPLDKALRALKRVHHLQEAV